jgi:DNA modification methylase
MNLAQADVQRLPVADNSIDLIFTDPPYHRKYIHLYSWLSAEAARVLKPGGFCLAMAGGMLLNENMRSLEEHLTWFWNYEVFMREVSTVIWPKRTVARNKPIIALSKGPGMPRCNVLSSLQGGGNDKRYHRWGQDVESARYFIDCFSKPGDIVLDPFVGGGTTIIASELIERRAVGFDVDLPAVQGSQTRLRNTEIPTVLPLFAQVLP